MSADPGRPGASTQGDDVVNEGKLRNLEEVEFEFSPDLFTHAFFSVLPVVDRPQEKLHDWSKGVLSVTIMFFVVFVQWLALWELRRYIYTVMHTQVDNAIYTGWVDVGANQTLSPEIQEKLCGFYLKHEDFGHASRITMPDGTVYGPTDDFGVFYAKKAPERTWESRYFVDDRSVLQNVLYMIEEGISFNPFFGLHEGATAMPGYSTLFMTLVALLICSVMIELRSISEFHGMLDNFRDIENKHEVRDQPCGFKHTEDGKIVLLRLNRASYILGFIIICLRVFLALWTGYIAVCFLLFTTVKVDLILNSLALLFVFEFDSLAYQGLVNFTDKNFLKRVEPIHFEQPIERLLNAVDNSGWMVRWSRRLIPILVWVFAILVAVYVRKRQLHVFGHFFTDAASLCLFAGPTPGGRGDLVASVPGVCESLLSTRCAADVRGPGAARGPCVVSDADVWMRDDSVGRYVGDGLFEGMRSRNGVRTSFVEWGDGPRDLYERRVWAKSNTQDLMRKICVQMYQPGLGVDERDNGADEMHAAPFCCKRDVLFDAFSGKARAFFEGEERRKKREHKHGVPFAENWLYMLTSVKDLSRDIHRDSSHIIRAIDECHASPPDPSAKSSSLLAVGAKRRGEPSAREGRAIRRPQPGHNQKDRRKRRALRRSM